jgi:hypothetical protein
MKTKQEGRERSKLGIGTTQVDFYKCIVRRQPPALSPGVPSVQNTIAQYYSLGGTAHSQ